MSSIRYVAPVPDHVTRYTHKQNRWMTPPKPYRQSSAGEVVERLILGGAFSVLIVVAVMLLQAV